MASMEVVYRFETRFPNKGWVMLGEYGDNDYDIPTKHEAMNELKEFLFDIESKHNQYQGERLKTLHEALSNFPSSTTEEGVRALNAFKEVFLGQMQGAYQDGLKDLMSNYRIVQVTRFDQGLEEIDPVIYGDELMRSYVLPQEQQPKPNRYPQPGWSMGY